ncbi:MAG TPA: helix-turn-helix domain-containing protein [Candidatus Limnocylindrales bacterium]|jgi:transcriptional regulator with XRE-family HTH domain|nr:helix-turn-helix domain-containing protein [Candidatus Limnocylindrales bacterium]
MPSKERSVDRATRRSRQDVATAGNDIRTARIAAGLTLSRVGSVVGLSASQVSRVERGLAPNVSVQQLGRVGAVVGLDVRVRTYPGPDPIRDAAQNALLGRLRARIHPRLRFRTEVLVSIADDQRAWDAEIGGLAGDPGWLPVEAETRIHDLQAQTRRIAIKLRDSDHRSVLVVVADTRTNRAAIRVAWPSINELFPIPSRDALAALADGRRPGGSALVFL